MYDTFNLKGNGLASYTQKMSLKQRSPETMVQHYCLVFAARVIAIKWIENDTHKNLNEFISAIENLSAAFFPSTISKSIRIRQRDTKV